MADDFFNMTVTYPSGKKWTRTFFGDPERDVEVNEAFAFFSLYSKDKSKRKDCEISFAPKTWGRV